MRNSNWDTIRQNALDFSNEWKNEVYERGEAQTFWNSFFNIFGINRKRVALFEKQVKKLNKNSGFIDLFWPGNLIIEHKSRDKDLKKAQMQAFDYLYGVSEEELPKYVLVCDFKTFSLYSLEENTEVTTFDIKDLSKNIHYFSFFLGQTKQKFKENAPVNIKAAKLMSQLRDKLDENNYSGHDLEIFLGRLLFCLFADDTGIFEIKDHLAYYLESQTREDGSDFGMHISQIFELLDTPYEKRQKKLDIDLAMFPYVNGALFSQKIKIPTFTKELRDIFLKCCNFNWEKISPAIFGSMFESIILPANRRNFGAHFTSEENILKTLKPLFLDELYIELEKSKSTVRLLNQFLEKIRNIKILDPACGCGNFLIIAYRELRLLEIEAHRYLKEILGKKHIAIVDHKYLGIDVDSMFGIELHESAAKIAQVALWIMDHQMNIQLSQELGSFLMRIPLKKSPTIIYKNSISLDWKKIGGGVKFDYIVGNPPYIGKQLRTADQDKDLELLNGKIPAYKNLDYVSLWFAKSSDYINYYPKTKFSFVATNSICQGEQAASLWPFLFSENLKIDFAYQTFKWKSESVNNAHVFVVIIGMSKIDVKIDKKIFSYDWDNEEHELLSAENINQYLVNGEYLFLNKSKKSIFNAPSMEFGSMANDGGSLIVTKEEFDELKKNKDLIALKYCKEFLGSTEYLNSKKRYCLWLKDISPSEIKKSKFILNRIKSCKEHREKSQRKQTLKLANFPTLFAEDRQPVENYIIVPRHSSEKRKIVPMEILPADKIVSDACMFIKSSELSDLAILQSSIFMSWVKKVAGRIKDDFRISAEIVYNNFPWPSDINDKERSLLKDQMKIILNVRNEYLGSVSIGDLYDPELMPAKLQKEHMKLDKIVCKVYGINDKASEDEIFIALTNQYNELFKNIDIEIEKMAKLNKKLKDKKQRSKKIRKAG